MARKEGFSESEKLMKPTTGEHEVASYGTEHGSVEDLELRKKIFLGELEVIMRERKPANAGSNGLIYYLSPGDAEMLTGVLEDEDTPFSGPVAAKMLKVYNAGAGKREFHMQKRAYDLVERVHEEDKQQYARVPKPLSKTTEGEETKNHYAGVPVPLLRDSVTMHISPETREVLNALGGKLVGNEVDVFLMEYLPGQDLAEVLFQEILKRSDFGEAAISKISADRGNFKRLLRFFEQHDIALNPHIGRKVKKTLELLHQNQMVHNDLHERNIVIDPDKAFTDDPSINVDIIDFDSAGKEQIEDAIPDARLPYMLQQLALTSADRAKVKEADRTSFLASAKRFVAGKGKSRYEAIQKSYEKAISNELALVYNSNSCEDFLRLLGHYLMENPDDESEKINYIEELLRDPKHSFNKKDLEGKPLYAAERRAIQKFLNEN